MKKLVLLAASLAMLSAAHAEQDWGPMPYPTPINEPTIRDFSRASHLINDTAGEPAYVDKFATYRMCTELALRALIPKEIPTADSMIYTAVRSCTRQMDDYVLLFVSDERFKANYYVGHAIQRLAQQEQIGDLRPLANRLRAGDASATHVLKK
ncbi:hypothetical protein GN316_08455 [Xylophilus sp. Kf1]|nr:hypothetical protein [Xylophilus sp. Kf1]